jgi:hypothetical protein
MLPNSRVADFMLRGRKCCCYTEVQGKIFAGFTGVSDVPTVQFNQKEIKFFLKIEGASQLYG